MPVTFAEIVSEITGIVPGYSAFLAKRDVQKAWRDILNRRTWSFLVSEGGFNAPSLVQVGSVTITQNSELVVFDATAAAALDTAVTETPTLTERQFRISTAGEIYSIEGWDSPTRTMTLDRPVLEPTSTTSSFLVYQCYFPPPPESIQPDGSYDFNRWISILDPINGWTLKDNWSKARMDRIDPQRSSTSLAYRYCDYKTDNGNKPLWEFWPHPTSGQTYVALYKANGVAFTSGNQPLPQCIPDGLLVDRTLYKYAYRWGQINAGRDPRLAKTNWGAMIRDADALWKVDLQAAKLQDENLYMTQLIGAKRRGWPFPIDAAYIQSHDVGGWSLQPWGGP